MLKASTIDILKQSVPALEEHGETITKLFYSILLQRYPELTNVFNFANQRSGNQAKALANAIFAYANLAEQPELLMPTVNRIANKHASLNIKAEHYPMVGESLLNALSQALELPMSHEIIQGWGDAYESLADVFIAHEKQLYMDSADKHGGWTGFREFIIDKIIIETPMVKSFYLIAKDGGALPSFESGQYVSIKLDIPNHPNQELRQYSLSDSPDRTYYRISVKAEQGAPVGTVSNYLHQQMKQGDKVSLSAPFGDFTFQEDSVNDNAVFISAGVGITPLMSMLKSQLNSQKTKQLTFIHCTQNAQTNCFKDDLVKLKEQSNFNNVTIYNDDITGDYQGIISQRILDELSLKTDADYYFCGPFAFMVMLRELLIERGVSEDKMHYEVFGPTLSLAA